MKAETDETSNRSDKFAEVKTGGTEHLDALNLSKDLFKPFSLGDIKKI